MKKSNNNILALCLLVIIEAILFRISSIYDNNILQTIVIVINTIITIILLLRGKRENERKANSIIAISLLIRTALLFFDIYTGKGLFTGKDTEAFYECALGISNGYETNSYSILLNLVANIIGPNRLVLQYINVLSSLVSMLYFKKILSNVSNNRISTIAFALFSLSPLSMLLSSSLLRESIMIMLNVLSINFFIKWFKNGNKQNFLLSLIMAIASTWLHSGMILVIFAYMISFILYEPKIKKISFRKNTIFALILVMLLSILIIAVFNNSLTKYFSKFDSLDSVGTVKEVANADYLPFLNNAPFYILAIFLPLKMLYFLFSPMIWDIRTASMIIAIIFSSSLYIYLTISLFKYKKIKNILASLIILAAILVIIPYAIGTHNSGAATRHREKILPFLVVAYAVKEREYRKNESN